MVVSSLFRYVEQLQAGEPWGRVLDAGTGVGSLRWLCSLNTERWDAITAAERMAQDIRAAEGIQLRQGDRLLIGDWQDEALLAGERYDTVLADYLLGAIDGFAPYWQNQLFSRLRPLVKRRLYVIGLEPYVPYLPADIPGKVISSIGRLRDSCLLLAGERPYREYPLSWVLRQLEASGFRVVHQKRFPIRFGPPFINGQLNMCVARAGRLADKAFSAALLEHIERVRRDALDLSGRLGGLATGADYVVCAEPAD